MRLNMNFLKEYYERLDEEQKEEHDITSYEDFISYIVGSLMSDMEYDFGYGVYYDDLIIEEDD